MIHVVALDKENYAILIIIFRLAYSKMLLATPAIHRISQMITTLMSMFTKNEYDNTNASFLR
jgi:hypothetical protein